MLKLEFLHAHCIIMSGVARPSVVSGQELQFFPNLTCGEWQLCALQRTGEGMSGGMCPGSDAENCSFLDEISFNLVHTFT